MTFKGNPYRHIKPVQIEGLPYVFRSKLEADIGVSLRDASVPFKYEEEVIRYTVPSRTARYTPDFKIGSIYIEAKGKFEASDRQKHLLVKEQQPDLDIRFVFQNPNQKIAKASKTTYAKWCEKHGFLYAKKEIPHSWLKEALRTTS